MQIKGMDISEFQGNLTIDGFKKAKASGIEFVIIRLGYTGQSTKMPKIDAKFENNYKCAMAAGLPVGVYYYSLATTEAEAKREAQYCIDTLKNKYIEYPVYIDMEDPYKQGKASKTTLANVCNKFCNTVAAAGYIPGVYASVSWFNNKIGNITANHTKWVAQYYTKCEYSGKYDMWQYSSTTKVPGIANKTDVSYCYTSFKKNNKKESYKEELPNLNITEKEQLNTKIGIALKDEKNKTNGGKIGDQTGKEVTIIDYSYTSKNGAYDNWDFVARLKDSSKAKKSADMLTQLCNNDKIGYDQKPSRGVDYIYKILKSVGFNPKKVSYVDTSSTPLICTCLKSNGVNIPTNLDSTNLIIYLKSNKDFEIFTKSNYCTTDDNLKVGDILCSIGNRTAMVVQEKGIVEKQVVKELKKKDSRKDEVKKLQKFLNWALDMKLTVDGVYGSNTESAVKKFQKLVGLQSTGEFGEYTLAKAKEFKN